MSVYRHPDWKEFLAHFRENPADNLARMVAADWLDERGEGDRATLFRVQVELDGFGPVPDSGCCDTSQSPSHWCAYQAWHEKHPRAHGLLRWADELVKGVAPEGFIGVTEPDGWTAASGNRYALYERGVLTRLGGNLDELVGGRPCPKCDGRGGEYRYPENDPTSRRLLGSQWYSCGVCLGEKVTPCHIRDALAVETPELVVPTDRWPSEWASGLSEDGREWAWERDMSGEDGLPNYRYLGSSPYTPDLSGHHHRLPPAVFDRMASKCRNGAFLFMLGIFGDVRFDTREEAMAAASAAIIEEYAP
jgi:uncharacterized protein (TIGR02996 family)